MLADFHTGDVKVRDLTRLHFVMQVIFALDAHGACLELHVQVLADENDRR